MVLDLNRDGKVELKNATYFDLNANGFHELSYPRRACSAERKLYHAEFKAGALFNGIVTLLEVAYFRVIEIGRASCRERV